MEAILHHVPVEKQRFRPILRGIFHLGTIKAHKYQPFRGSLFSNARSSHTRTDPPGRKERSALHVIMISGARSRELRHLRKTKREALLSRRPRTHLPAVLR